MGRADAASGTLFEETVRPHLAAMLLLASRIAPAADRDDVVQEALTLAWQRDAQFNPSRGSRRAWLLMLTVDRARRAHRRRIDDLPTPQHLQHVDDHHADVDLEAAIRDLPSRQRVAVALYYFLDLPIAEVAAVMHCAEGTVKATLSQARTRLRRDLGEDFPWTT